jgi:nitrogenase subunit NifH
MTTSTAILGKGGVGKTLVAAHLAMACGYLGIRTLLVGCDQKRDTSRAVGMRGRPCLMEAVELADGEPAGVDMASLIAPVSRYVDAIELGPSQLLVGDYAGVYETAFRVFELNHLLTMYDHVLYDVTDERFDAPNLPLFRTLNYVIGVTDDQAESLFVLNRMLRGMLIGWDEFGLPVRVLGVVENRSQGGNLFTRYAERSRALPLGRLPASVELGELRTEGMTLFGKKQLPRSLDVLIDSFLKMVEMLQGNVVNLVPVLPLSDDEIWSLSHQGTARN